MVSYRYQEVFVPGGFPQLTYNPRRNLNLEARLAEAKMNLCKLVTITGQTKSGKTVLARRVLPPEDSIWIDGGTIGHEDDFWQVLIECLELFQSTRESSSKETTSTIGAKGTAEANFLIAKGSGEVGAKMARARGKEITTSRTLSSRVVGLGGLRESGTPLVIDDFHYLPRDLQGSVVRALKPLVFDGLPVVIIAIPHRRYDAIKVEKEMTGRILPVEIPVWSETELRFIPETGFELLDLKLPDKQIDRLTVESIGSPHLMQDFCRNLCRCMDLLEPTEQRHSTINDAQIDQVFRDVSETIGRPIFEKLARGPRQRTDRVPRELKDGRKVDIYELVLHGLAHLRPGLVSIEYEDLRAAIRDVSASQIPQLHEISRVLGHMATIAASDQSSTPVIDFEEEEKKLHITDPFFAFYLRWGELAAV
ncbi:MAG: hypothetical protein HYY96_00590 [Candidatus Tectomicrobia bacterium]|nr:hypothetical protein [Candidatus Tectomicrobia bacterium]